MMASYFGPLSDGAVGSASLTTNSRQQTHILDLTKTVAESTLQFMYSCKEGGGNPKVHKSCLKSFEIWYLFSFDMFKCTFPLNSLSGFGNFVSRESD